MWFSASMSNESALGAVLAGVGRRGLDGDEGLAKVGVVYGRGGNVGGDGKLGVATASCSNEVRQGNGMLYASGEPMSIVSWTCWSDEV